MLLSWELDFQFMKGTIRSQPEEMGNHEEVDIHFSTISGLQEFFLEECGNNENLIQAGSVEDRRGEIKERDYSKFIAGVDQKKQ